jgi:hypothetical protein
MKEELSLTKRLSKRINQAKDHWSAQYNRVSNHLKYASGDMWDSNIKKARDEDDRPSMVVNLVKPKINKIVNPMRINKVGMRVELPSKQLAVLVNDKLRSIEKKSRADEGYQVAFECAVTSGIGWVHVILDYLNDETTDVEPRIKGVVNPTSVFLDPYSEEMDGSDAMWGFIMSYIDKDIAEDEYGEISETNSPDEQIADGSMYGDWLVPDNSVAEMIFYEIVEEELTRYFFAGGEYMTEGDEDFNEEMKDQAENERKIRKRKLICYKFIGGKEVDKTEFDCNYIPLIPVYGDRILTAGESDIKFAGQVHWNKDLNDMFNFYKSSELELVTNAPKNPWVAEESSIENYEDDWAESNTRPKGVLKYRSIVRNGVQVPAPFRADNVAQTQSIVQASNQAIADMDITSGVSQAMMGGGVGAGVESAMAILTKESSAEVTTAQYIDNLSLSLEQICRVVLNLLTYASDVDREESMVTENGQMYSLETNFKEILTPKLMSQLDVSVHGGSAYEGRRKEAMASMLSLGQMHPQGVGIVADLIAKNMDHPISDEASKRFELALPEGMKPEQGDNPPDPRATALLQQAQQDMEQMQMQMEQINEQSNYWKGLAEQLNTQLTDNNKDREVDLIEKQMDSETKLAVEQMKQTGANERELAKINAEQEKQNKDIMAKVMGDTQQMSRTPAEDIVPQMAGEVTPMNPDVIEEVSFGDDSVIDEVEF